MARIHPAVTGLYWAGTLLWIMWFSHPAYRGTLLVGLAVFGILRGLGGDLRRALPGYLVLGAGITAVNGLLSGRGRTVLWPGPLGPLTAESLLYGAFFAWMLINLMLAFRVAGSVFGRDRFLYLAAPVAPRTGLVITMAAGLLPRMGRRLGEIREAARVLRPHVPPTRLRRIREGMEQLGGLVLWTMESSVQTALSMRSRGYGTGPRTRALVWRFTRPDAGLLAVLGAGLAVLAAGGILGYGQTVFFPALTVPGIPPVHFGVLCGWAGVPALLEGRERLAWRDSVSDI